MLNKLKNLTDNVKNAIPKDPVKGSARQIGKTIADAVIGFVIQIYDDAEIRKRFFSVLRLGLSIYLPIVFFNGIVEATKRQIDIDIILKIAIMLGVFVASILIGLFTWFVCTITICNKNSKKPKNNQNNQNHISNPCYNKNHVYKRDFKRTL